MEQWRDIPGYEGIYQVSNIGRVRTCEGKTTYTERHGIRHWKQRVLKQKIHKNTYGRADARISLWKNREEKTWLVARLVGLAWCDGYSDRMTINHINGDHLDNRAENLEWLSLGDNVRKGYETGLFDKCQKQITLIGESDRASFASMAQASRFLGRNKGYVYNCIRTGRSPMSADGQVYTINGGGV